MYTLCQLHFVPRPTMVRPAPVRKIILRGRRHHAAPLPAGTGKPSPPTCRGVEVVC